MKKKLLDFKNTLIVFCSVKCIINYQRGEKNFDFLTIMEKWFYFSIAFTQIPFI